VSKVLELRELDEILLPEESERLAAAAKTYLERVAFMTGPKGAYDSEGRWHPSLSERQSCCDGVIAPSCRFRFTLLNHCRSLKHVSELHGVKSRKLRAYLKATCREIEARLLRLTSDSKSEGGK
jgi:hypothetical protein